MLDCGGINPNSPGFAQKPTIQWSERIRNCELPTEGIHFHIERVRSRTKNNDETFDASGELENLISNGAIISG